MKRKGEQKEEKKGKKKHKGETTKMFIGQRAKTRPARYEGGREREERERGRGQRVRKNGMSSWAGRWRGIRLVHARCRYSVHLGGDASDKWHRQCCGTGFRLFFFLPPFLVAFWLDSRADNNGMGEIAREGGGNARVCVCACARVSALGCWLPVLCCCCCCCCCCVWLGFAWRLVWNPNCNRFRAHARTRMAATATTTKTVTSTRSVLGIGRRARDKTCGQWRRELLLLEFFRQRSSVVRRALLHTQRQTVQTESSNTTTVVVEY
ncbi:hypothetical protein LZ31DRAFT_378083 [Colletotrichum somersetense]|nr:hypothetical protein LZ31DRAFT_378083 [Colletotrichum somersetense]